jgi:hypothetical protein
MVFLDKDKGFRIGSRHSGIQLSVYLYKIIKVKKIILQIIVPFLAGFGILIAFGFPLGQALVTGICAISGMYIGQYLSKRRAAKKVNL